MSKPIPRETVDFEIDYNEELFDSLNRYAEKHADIYSLQAKTGEEYVVLNNLDMIRHVLMSNNKNYSKGIGIDKVKILLGNGIMVSEGSFWLRQRRLIQPSFGKEPLKACQVAIARCNQRLIAEWETKCIKGEVINLNEEMSRLALNIILELLFSEDLGNHKEDSPFHILSKDSERDLRFALRFRSINQKIEEFIVARRTQDRWPPDFLTGMYNSRSKEDRTGMSTKELIDEVITMIVAGHETTASALTWCWHLLTRNKATYDQMCKEIRSEETQEVRTMDQTPYTTAVIQEALRLYPPGWLISRKAYEEDTLNDFRIEAGTNILISLYSIQRNSRFWSHPNAFEPMRFLNGLPRTDLSFLPFSTGPRKCIGDTLALMEMQVHLVMVTKHFQLLDENPGKTITTQPLINLRPKDPILLKLRPNKQLVDSH